VKLREAKSKQGWPICPGWRTYELGKYNISFEEENEAAVLRYVDCGEHFFNRPGQEGLIKGESVTGGMGGVNWRCGHFLFQVGSLRLPW